MQITYTLSPAACLWIASAARTLCDVLAPKPVAPKPAVPGKTCVKCRLTKPATAYRKSRKKCTDCANAQSAAKRRAAYIKNKDYVLAYNRRWRDAHPGWASEINKRYRQSFPDAYREYERNRHARHKERIRASRKKTWANRDKQKHRAYMNTWSRKKRRTSVQFRLSTTLRSRFYEAVKNRREGGSAVRDLGCSITELKRYIEIQWQPGMSWDNWGRGHHGQREWQIDHIKPLAAYDLSDPAEVAKACHYTNLQPLWALDNMTKGARVPAAAEHDSERAQ